MAVVLSLNCHNKTLSASLRFQNPNRNYPNPKYFRQSRNRISNFRLPIPTHTKTHHFLAVKGLGSDLDPITPQDDAEVNNLGVKAALSVLSFYKREISPLLLKSCRYVPTCSEYSMQAYKKYGFVKGSVLTTWRICRCNPLGGSGFDPPRWFDEERPPDV